MIRHVSALCAVLMIAVGTWAQNPPHQHSVTHVVVDGSKTPDAIPDSVAYRLWLLTVSPEPNATDKQRSIHKAHLNKLPLNMADGLALDLILSDFKRDYVKLIEKHNNEQRNQLAHGVFTSDDSAFLQQRDDLVARARAAIQQQLSFDGAAALDAHVKADKIHMQLHTSGGAQ